MNISESVTVNTEWSGPQGFMSLNIGQPDMGNITIYTSVVVIDSFGREESGEYSCTATLSLQMLNVHSMAVSKVKRVTVGKWPDIATQYIVLKNFSSHKFFVRSLPLSKQQNLC